MDWERIVSVGIAALCMTAIGVSATTLDSTVSQTPDDLIDFDDRQLPIGDDSTSDIDRQIKANKNAQDSGDDGSQAGAGEEEQEGGDGEEDKRMSGDEGAPESVKKPSDSERMSLGSGEESGSKFVENQNLLEKLLLLLLALLLLALAYRYRERLRALLLAPLALFEATGSAGRDRSDRDPWARVDPDDEVDRAWYGMVRQLDIERPWAKTPDECESAAVEAGLDPDAVETLTELFREKRYGSDGPTEQHRERARQCADRLDLGGRTV